MAKASTAGSRARTRRAVFGLLLRIGMVLACSSCARERAPEGELAFRRQGRDAEVRTLAGLSEQLGTRTVETEDPYYQAHKRFRAIALPALLSHAYGEPVSALRKRAFVLHALDGYAVTVEGARLLDDGAFVAIDDLDVPGFAPIGPRKVSPAPAYVVWEGARHSNLESHPRPWQLAAIELVDADALYPHTQPSGEPKDGAAMRGYQIFRERCIRCHAVNREGGHVGPDLNVPQSIVAYRPEPQIRDYIKNPLTFRYGAMPPNPDLGEPELDALIAYFRAMSTRPYDPGADGT